LGADGIERIVAIGDLSDRIAEFGDATRLITVSANQIQLRIELVLLIPDRDVLPLEVHPVLFDVRSHRQSPRPTVRQVGNVGRGIQFCRGLDP
jgi:hypothetical protein